MKLSNSDRILLTTLLPGEGKYEDLICIKDIRKKVEPTQSELVEWGLKTTENNQITWKPSEKKYEIKFSELETTLIKTVLQKKNEEKKLNENLLPLYQLFVVNL